jgi:hypothetical protein
MQVARLATGSSSTSRPRPPQDEKAGAAYQVAGAAVRLSSGLAFALGVLEWRDPPHAGLHAAGDTTKVASHGRQRGPGSAILLGSRLSCCGHQVWDAPPSRHSVMASPAQTRDRSPGIVACD